MNYLEASREIAHIAPDIENELKNNGIQDAECVIRIFTKSIKDMIRKNDLSRLFISLTKMDEMYKNGDSVLKNAVENNFIYSLDYLTAFSGKEYRQLIFSRLSIELQNRYSRQIYNHGI